MNIYEISKEIRDLEVLIEQNGGEVSEEIEGALHKMFLARDEKLGAIAYLLKTADAQEMIISAEVKRLNELKKSVATKSERLKALVADFLPKGEKWTNGLDTFSYRTSHAVEVDEGVELPEVYYRTKLISEVDKQKLSVDLKSGAVVPGALLVTRFNVVLK